MLFYYVPFSFILHHFVWLIFTLLYGSWESLHVYSVSLIYIMAAQPVLVILKIARCFPDTIIIIGAFLFSSLVKWFSISAPANISLWEFCFLVPKSIYMHSLTLFISYTNPNSPLFIQLSYANKRNHICLLISSQILYALLISN